MIDYEKLNAHRMSVSSLNLFAHSPKLYMQHVLSPEEVTTGYFSKGSAVDCLITEPEKFDDQFAIMSIERPSGMMGDLCQKLVQYSSMEGAENVEFADLFELAYKESGFKLSKEAVLKKFEAPNSEAKKYYNEIKKAGNKKLLSETEYAQVKEVVHMLKTNEHTKFYIEDAASHPLMETIDQMEIFFELEGVQCKAYLDRVIIDHTNKRVIPTDLKTTGKSVFEFEKSYIQYGYFRQGAFYTAAIRDYMKKDEKLKDYKLENFKFIVAEMDCENPPLVYQMSDEDIKRSLYTGGTLKSGQELKSVYQLLNELKWHREECLWDMRKEQLESLKRTGSLTLDIIQ